MKQFTSPSNSNNLVRMSPVQQKMIRRVGSNEMKTLNHSPSSTAENLLELLDLLQSAAVTPTKTVTVPTTPTPTPRRGRRSDIKDFATPRSVEDSTSRRTPLRKSSSCKTEPSNDTPRVRKPPRRASSSMEIKPLSPDDFYNESVTKSLKSDDSKRRKSLKEVVIPGSKTTTCTTNEVEEKSQCSQSNCSMAENSFFQDCHSCFGDFQKDKKKKKKELKLPKSDLDFGSLGFNAETIREEDLNKSSSNLSGIISHGSTDDQIDGDEPRRRRSRRSKKKQKHHIRHPPQRQPSVSDGLLLHSSSAIATSKDEDTARRRLKKCSSGGRIRNNHTLEEYTGFFLASLGNDNVKHGFGITRFRDGRLFEGLYEHGRMVEGKMTYPVAYQGQSTSTTYIGKFDEDGLRSGRGIYTTATATYVGEFYQDDQEGSGILIYHDDCTDGSAMQAANPAASTHCRRFVGHWKEGQRHGYGKEILADGTVFEEGLWENGLLLEY